MPFPDRSWHSEERGNLIVEPHEPGGLPCRIFVEHRHDAGNGFAELVDRRSASGMTDEVDVERQADAERRQRGEAQPAKSG